MGRQLRFLFSSLVSVGLAASVTFGQHHSKGGPILGAPTGSASSSSNYTPPVNSYFYPTFGGYGGYFSPFLDLPFPAPVYNYLPNYWWTGPNSGVDPRQEGYNPASGYPPESVSTLLLVTYPAQARVTLDGVYVGTADRLGPTQLPFGEHTLRVDAPSYEPSETVLKVEQPALQQLEVRLNPVAHAAKPAPQP